MTPNVSKTNPAVPPINQSMQMSALRIAAAIETLTEKGFVAIGIECSNGAIPTVQVQASAACAELVEKGEAAYYHTGGSGLTRYRIGQFKIDKVRVIWTEQAN